MITGVVGRGVEERIEKREERGGLGSINMSGLEIMNHHHVSPSPPSPFAFCYA